MLFVQGETLTMQTLTMAVSVARAMCLSVADQRYCRTRGRPKGDLLFVGALHPHHAPHSRPFRKLPVTAQEDTSYP